MTKEAINTALIIDDPWIDYILRGEKIWEMRAQATRKRGRIGLIKKGSGAILGEATLIDCLAPLSRTQMLESFEKHRIPPELIVSGEVEKWRYPWVLANVQRYSTPVPYEHPNGAVIWVRLEEVARSAPQSNSAGSGERSRPPRQASTDAARLVQQAEELASTYLARTGEPTKYIAGFSNKQGRQLALERNRRALFVWVELPPPLISGVSIRNSKNPGQPYSAKQSRNSNLRSRAPRLAEGHVAYYLSVDDLECFEQIIRWYAQ